MIETTFNIFDAGVMLILVLSALLSFFRGFVREVLSLGAWVGASLITMYQFPQVVKLVEPQVNRPELAFGIAIMGTFVVALIVISIFNAILLQLLKKGKDVGLLDNLLGLMFGVLRASLLISLAYYVLSMLMSEKNFPDWLATAQTRPYVEMGAEVLKKVAPDYLNTMLPMDQMMQPNGEPVDPNNPNPPQQQMIENLMQQMQQGQTGEEGYDSMNADALQRMIESTQQQMRGRYNIPPEPNITE